MSEITALLEASRTFAGLTAETLALLRAVARRRVLTDGEVLFRRGTPRSGLYVLVEGRLAIVHGDVDHEETLVVLGPGEAVGEGSLLHTSEHSATARSLGRALLLEFPREALREALARDGRAAIEVLSRVALNMNRRLQYASPRQVGLDKAYAAGTTRREHDLLGDRDVPDDALYGIQTLRAVENFPITGVRLSHFPVLVRSLAMVKQACARANRRLGLLS
ncbi:MAG: cyclic nucleotide-binding domain-containing protein, partial [Acidobacteriota bacterium]